jgi:hypothetical protein
VNRLTSGLVSMTFISLAGWITIMPGCFFLYAGVGVPPGLSLCTYGSRRPRAGAWRIWTLCLPSDEILVMTSLEAH